MNNKVFVEVLDSIQEKQPHSSFFPSERWITVAELPSSEYTPKIYSTVEVCHCLSQTVSCKPHSTLAENGFCKLCGYATFFVKKSRSQYEHISKKTLLECSPPELTRQERVENLADRATVEQALEYLQNLEPVKITPRKTRTVFFAHGEKQNPKLMAKKAQEFYKLCKALEFDYELVRKKLGVNYHTLHKIKKELSPYSKKVEKFTWVKYRSLQ